ncbi:uncharacterized protein LOC143549502 [Bidens hawaiensis]|uniref:uncharacterized protein LOC143549502 n=1 Tax=Bidens hawaiensis TaxID=980011 RepID=UPI00404943B5
MRQRRCVELLNDYECAIKYHPGKANVVADALSRKETLKPRRVRALQLMIHSGLPEKIRDAQLEALKAENFDAESLRGVDGNSEVKSDGIRYYHDQIWVPRYGDLRTLVDQDQVSWAAEIEIGDVDVLKRTRERDSWRLNPKMN